MIEDNPLFYREPRQARSRQMVERLLNATLVLLERTGIAELSTNHIAQEAGVDIASLYRYFGSKEAILCVLTNNWIAKVQAVYARYADLNNLDLPFVALLRQVNAELSAIPDTEWGYRLLASLMESLPCLRELEKAHELVTARFWTQVFRHYGARWDDEKLLTFARMFYVEVDTALSLAGRLPPQQARHVLRWQRSQAIHLLRLCLPKKKHS
ncbi:TetR/AcrR family transcriptional regulator [Undibacterium parvum]|uniref:TetR/AcrR family transcriptional regulator n=2 Tax=Undibacterium TaxID=401469 RepID=A0A6M4A4V7_9BURK|nr:TetR/AcrR family transcriptional regulator [Undibacterium parvum]AZP11316.1 TetR/AcrR family transcriptional regulator [Undibacterium parvum]QJQ05810.1 TetR/AcrR family transcriptional regulator [Undibacterium piscinae]